MTQNSRLQELIEAFKSTHYDTHQQANDEIKQLVSIDAVHVIPALLQDDDLRLRTKAIVFASNLVVTGVFDEVTAHIDDEALHSHVIYYLQVISNQRALDLLLSRLRNEDGTYNLRVVRALGAIEQPDAIAPLIKVVQNATDRGNRISAIHALAQYDDNRVEPALMGALDDADPDVRRAATTRLTELIDPTHIPALITLLQHDPDENNRLAIIKTLETTGGTIIIEPLIASLDDDSRYVREQAARILGEMKTPLAVDALCEVITRDRDVTRRHAIKALGQIGDIRAVEPLLTLFASEQETENRLGGTIAEALGEIGDVRAVEPLIHALTSDEPYLYKRVTIALGKLKDKRAIEPLIGLFKRVHVGQDSIARVLGQLGDKRAVEPLIEALDDNRPSVTEATAMALGALRDNRAVKPLIQAFDMSIEPSNDRGSGLRAMIAQALGEIGHPDGIPTLAKAFTDRVDRVRINAANALRKLKTKEAHMLLYRAFEHPDIRVQQAAAIGLLPLGEQRAFPIVVSLLDHKRYDVKLSALHALSDNGSPEAMTAIIGFLDNISVDLRLRTTAVEALGRPDNSQAVDRLRQLLERVIDNPENRRSKGDLKITTITNALNAIGTPDSLQVLRDFDLFEE
ncbi:MAG: HEAT repeat domain-containing protein [Chloroflexota bacterium]